MMRTEAIVLQEIPFKLDLDSFITKLCLAGNQTYINRATELAQIAQEVARPKALYRPAYIDINAEKEVVIEGITFKSRILSVNLKELFRVFPFIVTSGIELEAWSKSQKDLLEQFWADVLKEMAMRTALETMLAHVTEQFGLGGSKLSQMNPGSLKDWPLTEQRQLFQLIGDAKEKIGVELTESLIMYPVKSVSGIVFPSDIEFANCQLCPRAQCPGRRVPFEPDLYQKKFARKD